MRVLLADPLKARFSSSWPQRGRASQRWPSSKRRTRLVIKRDCPTIVCLRGNHLQHDACLWICPQLMACGGQRMCSTFCPELVQVQAVAAAQPMPCHHACQCELPELEPIPGMVQGLFHHSLVVYWTFTSEARAACQEMPAHVLRLQVLVLERVSWPRQGHLGARRGQGLNTEAIVMPSWSEQVRDQV